MKVEKTSQRQGVTRTRAATAVDEGGGSRGDFASILKGTLERSGAKKADEEALFSSLVQDRVQKTDNIDALKKFDTRLTQHRKILAHQTGHVSEEKAAKFALRDLVRNKILSKAEATDIYSKSFAAAQLDDDAETLSDGIGGPSAGLTAEAAVVKAGARMAAFDSGSETVVARNLGERTTRGAEGMASSGETGSEGALTPTGSAVDGPTGFLFKPVSDTQGKLVILAPESLTSKIDSVVLKDSDGNVLETGQYGGVGNGNRAHFRFQKPGGSYPKELTVEIKLDGGGSKVYTIPDPSLRYD